MDVFARFAEGYDLTKVEEMLLQDYLLGCRDDPMMRATTAERMVAAIGEPELVDTSHDQRLGRIFLNRTIKRYKAFADLYGTEETIERVVGFFRHASQGLEERKQILYLLGPVGGGKSTLAEILKQLIEKEPVYVLKAGDQISPRLRVAARPLRPRALRRPARGQVQHPAAAADRADVALGGPAAAGVRAATSRSSRW